MALKVLTPFALGYFLTYLLRAVNAVVAPDLVSELGLDAAELGLLTAAYLGAFAIFQLPLGVLLDRYGPRRVQAALVAVAGAGCVLFAIGSNGLTLTVARAMIGMGFAGGLMSGFKAVVLWVPEPRRALANAFVMSFGALGLLTATAPTELAVQAIGWRMVFLALAAITFGVALIILTVVPERESAPSTETLVQQVRQLLGIYRDKAFLVLAPLLAATAGTHIAIQTLWAGPWFRDVAGLDRIGVANHLFVTGAAFLVGILSSGAIADWFVRRGANELSVMAGFLALFLLSQVGIVLEVTVLEPAVLDPVRHERAGGGAGLSLAVGALRRRAFGARQHGHEPAAVPRRVRHPVRDRGDHRALSRRRRRADTTPSPTRWRSGCAWRWRSRPSCCSSPTGGCFGHRRARRGDGRLRLFGLGACPLSPSRFFSANGGEG